MAVHQPLQKADVGSFVTNKIDFTPENGLNCKIHDKESDSECYLVEVLENTFDLLNLPDLPTNL